MTYGNHRLLPLAATLILAARTITAQPPPSTDIFLVALERGVARGAPINITSRLGYDNQPFFLEDGRRLLYTAFGNGDQTDIWLYDLGTRERRRLTETPESEYSPTPIPGEDAISVVRVEADEKQRLWRFPLDGGAPDLLLPDIEPVGYHAWGDPENLILYVLGEPNTLQHARRGAGPGKVLAEGIGRSLHRMPESKELSFVHQEGEKWTIKSVDLATGRMTTILPTRPGQEDFTHSPSGELWAGDGAKLFRTDPGSGRGWVETADFEQHGLSEITRLAVHPKEKWIAFVAISE